MDAAKKAFLKKWEETAYGTPGPVHEIWFRDGYNDGYHERDAEIERLRQGITRLKALASLPGDSPGLPLMRLGMIRKEARELLKGGA